MREKYNFELDGEDVGDFNVDPSTGIMFSVRDLEETRHTLKVSLKDNERFDTYMDYRGVNIYSTPDFYGPNSSIIFKFTGSGFNLFGATQDALIDVYVDDELVDEDVRIYATGDRQTSYYVRGLEDTTHIAKIEVKGGTFTLDGIDVILGVSSEDHDGDENGEEGGDHPGDEDGDIPGDENTDDETGEENDDGTAEDDDGSIRDENDEEIDDETDHENDDKTGAEDDDGTENEKEEKDEGDQSIIDVDQETKDEQDAALGSSDKFLPKTASPMYNFLFTGVILLLIGGVAMFIHKRKMMIRNK